MTRWGFNVSTLFTYSLERHRTEERARRKLKSPARSFQHSLAAASKTQRGTWRKKIRRSSNSRPPSLLSWNLYWFNGQTWLHGKKAGGIWQLGPLAQQKGVQLVSVRACLQKLTSWYPYRHMREQDQRWMKCLASMRAAWWWRIF